MAKHGKNCKNGNFGSVTECILACRNNTTKETNTNGAFDHNSLFSLDMNDLQHNIHTIQNGTCAHYHCQSPTKLRSPLIVTRRTYSYASICFDGTTLASSYIPIAEEDRKHTAFLMPWGRYEYLGHHRDIW